MQNKIQLPDHFDYRRLIRFTFPSVLMMIFTSIYGVVDGFFVSNFVGKTSFAAVNFIMPFLVAATIVSGVVLAVFSILFLRPIATLMGARGEMLEECVKYGRIILVALPFLMLQYAFSSLVVTAEKPKLGLILTIVTGVLNMTGDALFMAVFRWGIAGAALATALGQVVGGMVPLLYFARKNSSRLRLCRP